MRRLLLYCLLLVLPASAVKAQPEPSTATLKSASTSGGKKSAYVLPDSLECIQNIEYGRGGESKLLLDLVRLKAAPERPMPAIVLVHGGSWKMGDKKSYIPVAAVLAQGGYLCVTINYRLSQEAIFPAQLEDCKCAVRFLRAHAAEYKIDPDRIGAWGASAGGHLVALLGTTANMPELEGKGGWEGFSSRVQAVCDWFGPSLFGGLALANPNKDSASETPAAGAAAKPQRPSSVAQLLGGTPAEKPELAKLASPALHVTPDTPPFLIMHGTKDPLVSFEQSEIMQTALRKMGVSVTLRPVEGAGHGGAQFREPEIMREVSAFFDRYLKPQAASARR